jgi:hypothetical protein
MKLLGQILRRKFVFRLRVLRSLFSCRHCKKQPTRYAALYYRMFKSSVRSRAVPPILHHCKHDSISVAPLVGHVPMPCSILLHCPHCFPYSLRISERFCEGKLRHLRQNNKPLDTTLTYQTSLILSSVYQAVFGPTGCVEVQIYIQLVSMICLALW